MNLPAPQIDALLQMQFTAQRASYEAWFPGSEHSIVLLDGQPAGRIWVARLDGQIRIIDAAMMPECRNLGLGRQVFSRYMRESEESGIPLRTSVQKLNFGSLRFHSRLGFRPVGEDPMSYEMEWRAAPSSV